MPEHAVTCSSVASMSANEGPGASSAAAAAAAAMGKFESVSCAGLGAGGDAVGESSCLSDPANVAKCENLGCLRILDGIIAAHRRQRFSQLQRLKGKAVTRKHAHAQWSTHMPKGPRDKESRLNRQA